MNLKIVWVGLVLAFTGGCVPEFSHPLPLDAAVAVDPAVLGHWVSREDDGKESHLHFFTRADGWYDIVLLTGANARDKSDELDCTFYEGYTSRAGDRTVLSLREKLKPGPEDRPAQKFFLCQYVLQLESLDLFLFNEEKLKTLVEAGALSGTVTTNSKILSVQVDAGSADVLEVVKARPMGDFVNDESPWQFQRGR